MKIIKLVGAFLLILVVGLVAFFFYFKSTHQPQYTGEIVLKGLNEQVDVYFTEYGIPHIYAKTDEDAYYAFGYVHAQDRLWQMDLLRHVGSGSLSELFGQDLIKTDKYLRTMGLGKHSTESAVDYLQRNHESLPLVQAYLAGINEYIATKPKTLEHTILGLDIEPFTEQNVFEVITYMAFSFSNGPMTDPFLTELSNKLDSNYLKDLHVYHYEGETVIPNYDARFSKLSNDVVSAFHNANIPEFKGSNSWVLSGKKTTSGQVILANDPHIAFSQPSVWYEAHLNMPGTEYYGYFIAGSPFPPILHTTEFSNGLTMFENDDVDFYIEEIHPEDSNNYRYKTSWEQMNLRNETIKVKDSENIDIVIRSTKHGPVVSDILKDDPLEDIVSMYWVTTNFDNYILETLHGFTQTVSLHDFEEKAGMIHGPGLNVMYGDKEGNIAWWASGKLIQRKDERTSKQFYDGSTGLNDPDNHIPFEKNPRSINPPSGYIFTANNQPDTVDGVIYSGYYLPDDRAERIKQLIDSKDRFSVEDVKAMQLDEQSKMFERIKGVLLYSIKDTDKSELLRDLLSWDATFNKDDYRPTIFQKWLYEVLEHTMKDEMGDELWESYKATHTYKVAIEHLVLNENSVWWDDIGTEEIEDRIQIIRHSFEEAMVDLTSYWGADYKSWTWGKSHILTHRHAMGSALSFLSIGPFEVTSGNEVINNMGFSYSGDKIQDISFGPSTRRIIDFSDVRNNSWSILPTGQSGNYFSPHYDDQAEMFINGEFRKMMMNEVEINKSPNKLVLHPNN
ncbi:MAG: penicillin acylase family protein [Cyclobacteriaceae bacterium]